jgi:cell wall-associated NlpC family hydrolase
MDNALRALCNGRYVPEGRGELDAHGVHQFDCWGFVMAIFAHFGVEVPDYTEHPDNFDLVTKRYEAACVSPLWERIDTPQVPCLVAMATIRPDVCNHFGVFLGNGVFVHVQKNRGVHTDRIDTAPWPRFVHSFWRYVG